MIIGTHVQWGSRKIEIGIAKYKVKPEIPPVPHLSVAIKTVSSNHFSTNINVF